MTPSRRRHARDITDAQASHFEGEADRFQAPPAGAVVSAPWNEHVLAGADRDQLVTRADRCRSEGTPSNSWSHGMRA